MHVMVFSILIMTWHGSTAEKLLLPPLLNMVLVLHATQRNATQRSAVASYLQQQYVYGLDI